jgi:hypothetical protein
MRAVEVYDAGDIEEAVNRFLRGQVDWHNQSFAPSAAMLGSEAKRLRDARLESAARERRMRPALPPPDIEKTPEQRAKAAEMVKNFVASVSPDVVDADAALRAKSQWAKVNARFMPEQTEEAIRQRCMSEWEASVGASDEWYTPAYVFDAMGLFFDLDAQA